jgi:hypothetical protein
MNHWRAVCIERCMHGSEGGRWNRAVSHLASVLPYSGHTLRLLMVLAGTLIKTPTFSVRIVTGLPVKVWDNEATVPQVQRALCGTHQFVLNRQPRVMHVEGVMVVMEGAGALAVHGLAEDVPQAVIDIGGRTVRRVTRSCIPCTAG